MTEDLRRDRGDRGRRQPNRSRGRLAWTISILCVLFLACRPSEDEAVARIARDLEASHGDVQDLMHLADGLGHDENQLLAQVERDRSLLLESENSIHAVRETLGDLVAKAATESACELSIQVASGQQVSDADIVTSLTNSLATEGVELAFGEFAAARAKLALAIQDIQDSSDPQLSALELELSVCGHLSGS